MPRSRRLIAQLAAFASERRLGFCLLPPLASAERSLVEKLATTLRLGAVEEVHGGSVLKLHKLHAPQESQPAQWPRPGHDHSAILDACDKFGARPLAALLAAPLTPQLAGSSLDDSAAEARRAGARNLSLLVRACAAHGRLEPMLDALAEGQESACLLAHPPSHNAAVAAAMAALVRQGRAAPAIQLYEESVVAWRLLPSSRMLLQLCVAAKREGRAAAGRAIGHVAAAKQAGATLEPPAYGALLHCCALAADVDGALEAFGEALGCGHAGVSAAGPSSRPASARLETEAGLRMLSSVLTACARARDRSSASAARELAERAGLQLDLACESGMINVLARTHDASGAVRMARTLLREHAPRHVPAETRAADASARRGSIRLDDLTRPVNAALAACKHVRRPALALSLLDDAMGRGVPADTISFTSLIGACAGEPRHRAAGLAAFEVAVKHGVGVDEMTVAAVANLVPDASEEAAALLADSASSEVYGGSRRLRDWLLDDLGHEESHASPQPPLASPPLGRIVTAMEDPNPQRTSPLIELLRDALPVAEASSDDASQPALPSPSDAGSGECAAASSSVAGDVLRRALRRALVSLREGAEQRGAAPAREPEDGRGRGLFRPAAPD